MTSSGNYLITSATYNANGTMSAKFDANNNKTTFTYGQCNSGLLTKTVFLNSLNTQSTWDSGCDGPVIMSAMGMDGNTTTTVYADPFWRKTSVTDPSLAVTSFYYTATSFESTPK